MITSTNNNTIKTLIKLKQKKISKSIWLLFNRRGTFSK